MSNKEELLQIIQNLSDGELEEAKGLINSVIGTQSLEFNPEAKPLWEQLAEIGAEVPDAEWAKVPKDFAQNAEHYLYGSTKES